MIESCHWKVGEEILLCSNYIYLYVCAHSVSVLCQLLLIKERRVHERFQFIPVPILVMVLETERIAIRVFVAAALISP